MHIKEVIVCSADYVTNELAVNNNFLPHWCIGDKWLRDWLFDLYPTAMGFVGHTLYCGDW